MRINHNIQALIAYTKLNSNQMQTTKVMEKLSTGLRINRAADDAAGLAVSEKMRGQIKGLQQAERNTMDAISLLQTAEGAMNEMHSILQRMRELTVQATNGTYTAEEKSAIQQEITELKAQVDFLSTNTKFNTEELLNGTGGILGNGSFTFQLGANDGENMEVTFPNFSSASIGIDTLDLTATDLGPAYTAIDNAVKFVSEQRTYVGAVQNRLEHHYNSLTNTTENLTAAESRIRDANMALEMAEYTKLNIINQSAQAMLAKSNQYPEMILQLLKG